MMAEYYHKNKSAVMGIFNKQFHCFLLLLFCFER
jgi:hypothetical protein